MKYAFGTNINGTKETGIIEFTCNPPKLLCVCDKENSEIILKAFRDQNKHEQLHDEIAKQYFDENGNELPDDSGFDLGTIGEVAAIHYGFL